jgi:hypothetical protein
MSYSLQAALVSLLGTDATLVSWLGAKADSSAAIYPSHPRDVSDPPYPLITIERIGSGMRPDIFSDVDVYSTTMDNPRMAIKVWDKTNIDTCWKIYRRVDLLLRGQPPVTPIPSVYMTNYKFQRKQVRDNLFDDATNSYCLYAEYETWVMDNPIRSITPGITVPPPIVNPQIINPSDQVTSTFTALAGSTISGQKAVVQQVDGTLIYDDSTEAGFMDRPPYLSLNGATVGNAVTCVVFGFVEEPTWSWTPDLPIYLGPNGALTQTVPTLAAGNRFSLQLGVPSSPTQILWDPQIPVTLS